jgi:hypothetical protein
LALKLAQRGIDMAGTINLSLTQQLDEFGNPLSGGQLYFIQAGTVATPQDSYQDEALTIKMPYPITLDAAGRVPQFFLADGQIKVRLQDRYGVVKFVADNLLVIGPSTSGGGGGGGSVDPTTVMQTGDIKIRYDNAILTGFVRCNGNSIGSSTSGATELADPSAQALFQFLWGVDSTLAVAPGGRGASAIADWTANKRISLPDCRGRPLTGLSGMGASDSGLFTGVTFGHGDALTLGSYGGGYSKTIPVGALPSHQHNVFLKDPTHNHTVSNVWQYTGAVGAAVAGTGTNLVLGSPTTSSSPTGLTIGSVSGTANDNKTALTGSGGTFDLSNPFMLITIYLKL